MGLDQRGGIAIAEIVFYAPILVCALLLTIRHGIGRQAGWVFLLSFSIVRILGGAIHAAAEEVNPPKTGLFIAAFAIESAGVAPLLLCTSSWLHVISAHVNPLMAPLIFRVVRTVLIVAFALAIVGATRVSSSSASDRSTGATLRKAGGVIILACFLFMGLVHVLLWSYKSRLYTRHRKLLVGISAALPFLFVRCIYSVLSAFSPVSSFGGSSSSTIPPVKHTALSKFNSFSGSWQIFLVMSLLMEYIVVLIYLSVGAVTPLEGDANDGLEEDLKDGDGQGLDSGMQRMYLYKQKPLGVDAYGSGQVYAA